MILKQLNPINVDSNDWLGYEKWLLLIIVLIMNKDFPWHEIYRGRFLYIYLALVSSLGGDVVS